MSFLEDNNAPQLVVDDLAKAQLLEAGRWTKFLGIIYIIFMVLIMLCAIAMGSVLNRAMVQQYGAASPMIGSGLISGLYLLIVMGLMVYPVYSLLRYSGKMKKGIQHNDQYSFNEGLRAIKGFFKYNGILLIVVIGIYLVFFIALMVGLSAFR
ncbi:MAG: hypothetical protein H0X33_02810 [Taibaiella sp.]|nr:hypothetical protein [Taibaiella sp.]